jgi:Dehydrogenases with different specificities (related to short-chain alcohol dehydrogenases)
MSEPTRQPLAGKTVLITGGARRIGAEIARTLHGAGANIVLHYRSSEADAKALQSELERARSGSVCCVQADLLDVRTHARVVDAAREAFGRLDVLVNNASTFYPTTLGEITEAHWDELVGTNLKVPLFLSQAAAAALRAARGLVINLVDIHAFRPLRRYPVYCAAKAGLVMLTKSLARELAPEVRVNGIAPGPVLWPEDGLEPEVQAHIIDRTLLKRPGSPQDIARTALFFAADAPYVTGQILAVDGGRSVAW